MVENDIEKFKKELITTINKISKMSLQEIKASDVYRALGVILQDHIGEDWTNTHKRQQDQKSKRMYYLSMEFLTGKFTAKNLQYLGLYKVAKEAVESIGFSFEDVLAVEAEPGLGNGGLGRLAAAFLDSLASLKLPGHGYGLRYERGLFKQLIEDGAQKEVADNWIKEIDIWQYKREDAIYEIKLGGRIETDKIDGKLIFKHVDYESIKAEAYDIPVLGYKNGVVNNLRLWKASSYQDINLDEFAKGNYRGAYDSINRANSITQFLYPNDSNYEGKKLRLEQEYFLVSASVQDIFRKFKKKDLAIEEMPNHIAIHTNDTHPALAIPEFMRILLDNENLEWKDAWEITTSVFAFTNHTILSEAMETWDMNLYRAVLPRIFQVTEEINNKFMYFLRETKGITQESELSKLSILWNNQVRMVNLSIIGAHSVNGVAQLHTDILKDRELNHFYKLYPEKFNNKTNGIVHRKWLLQANKELTSLLKEKIGEDFVQDARKLEKFLEYKNDEKVYDKLADIKLAKKQELADIIYEEQGIVLNPYSIFDIQIKRIHEYKRQLLNILHIIYLYDKLKENPNLDMVARTFIFAGKAAPGYHAAKEIIKLINAVAEVVNEDTTIKDKLKVVFVDNYNVSKAMHLIPAADVSEQISTTTKEASGTGNMKFMMNGAITLATLDGANVEISKAVGEDNIVIFGMKAEEVYEYYEKQNYNSRAIYEENEAIRKTVDHLIDEDFFNDGITFRSLYDDLITYNDTFFVLKDFIEYRNAQAKIDKIYRNQKVWMKMSLINTAKSGVFSSDNTIRKYANEIWDINPL